MMRGKMSLFENTAANDLHVCCRILCSLCLFVLLAFFDNPSLEWLYGSEIVGKD